MGMKVAVKNKEQSDDPVGQSLCNTTFIHEPQHQ